jgi:hypothetical protein
LLAPSFASTVPHHQGAAKHLGRPFGTASLVQDLFPLIPWR